MSFASVSIEFSTESCCACGAPIVFPKSMMEALRKSGKTFYCPSGHPQSYTDGEQSKLRQEIQSFKYRLEAEQNQVEREKRRADGIAEVLQRHGVRVHTADELRIAAKLDRHGIAGIFDRLRSFGFLVEVKKGEWLVTGKDGHPSMNKDRRILDAARAMAPSSSKGPPWKALARRLREQRNGARAELDKEAAMRRGLERRVDAFQSERFADEAAAPSIKMPKTGRGTPLL